MAKKKVPHKAASSTDNDHDINLAKLELAEYSYELDDIVGDVLQAARRLNILKKKLEHFWLLPMQRLIALSAPGISKTMKKKLAKEVPSCTFAEVANLTRKLAVTGLDSDSSDQVTNLLVAEDLVNQLYLAIEASTEERERKANQPIAKVDSNMVYQFKIMLLDSEPAIWRRIQVLDCSLDELHRHIQIAMGWENYHMHQFLIDGNVYSSQEMLGDRCSSFECFDSGNVTLGQVIPEEADRFAFLYEYDFGDGWEHEIVFEKRLKRSHDKIYPICVAGKEACPPEDIGGIWGFYGFLEALADPNHADHEYVRETRGDGFDAKYFDAAEKTELMRNGFPSWETTDEDAESVDEQDDSEID